MGSLSKDGNSVEVVDGEPIKEAARSLGVPFSCEDGVCGSCLVDVELGEDNLDDLTSAEKDFGLMDNKSRLCCQAKLKEGDVEVKEAY